MTTLPLPESPDAKIARLTNLVAVLAARMNRTEAIADALAESVEKLESIVGPGLLNGGVLRCLTGDAMPAQPVVEFGPSIIAGAYESLSEIDRAIESRRASMEERAYG